MSRYLALSLLILLAIPIALAQPVDRWNQSGTGQWDDTGSTTTPTPTTTSSSTNDQANRFLSAELARQVKASKEEMLAEMQEYQDENFRIFDSRMTEMMDETKWKVTLGAIGAALLAMGLGTFLIIKTLRDTSYERFLEEKLAEYNEQMSEGYAMGDAQQKDWYPQVPKQTLGMAVGQEQAFDMTQMNQWQAQPAYDGSWRAPIETQPEVWDVPPQSHDQRDWSGYPQSWDNQDEWSEWQ